MTEAARKLAGAMRSVARAQSERLGPGRWRATITHWEGEDDFECDVHGTDLQLDEDDITLGQSVRGAASSIEVGDTLLLIEVAEGDFTAVDVEADSDPATAESVMAVVREALPLIPGLVNGADCTAALAAWHAALPPSGGAGRFPPGLFLFQGAVGLSFTKPVELRGSGPLATELRNTNTDGQHFLWLRGDRSGVHDMHVNGMRAAQTVNGGSAVNFAGTGTDAQELTPIKDIKMSNVRASGNGFDCVGLVAVDGFDLHNVDCDDIYDTGLDLVEGTSNGTIRGGTIRCAGRWGFGADTAYETTVGVGSTTSGSAVITGVSPSLGYFWPGQKITGAGIPVGATVIAAVPGSGSITISAPATATATVALFAVSYTKVRNVKIIGTTVIMLPGPDVRHAFLAQSAEMLSFIGVTADLSAAGSIGIRCDQNSRLVTIESPTIVGGSAEAFAGVQFEGLGTEYPAAIAQDRQSSLVGGNIVGFMGGVRAGVQLDNVIGVTVSATNVRDCQRGYNLEGSAARPVSDVIFEGTSAVGCDISYRFGGTAGANKGQLVAARSRGATSFDWAIDPAWEIRHMGKRPPTVYQDPGATVIAETLSA